MRFWTIYYFNCFFAEKPIFKIRIKIIYCICPNALRLNMYSIVKNDIALPPSLKVFPNEYLVESDPNVLSGPQERCTSPRKPSHSAQCLEYRQRIGLYGLISKLLHLESQLCKTIIRTMSIVKEISNIRLVSFLHLSINYFCLAQVHGLPLFRLRYYFEIQTVTILRGVTTNF